VLNIRAEHDRFIDMLTSFDRPIIAGFEATGNNHRDGELLAAAIVQVAAFALHAFRVGLGWARESALDRAVTL